MSTTTERRPGDTFRLQMVDPADWPLVQAYAALLNLRAQERQRSAASAVQNAAQRNPQGIAK